MSALVDPRISGHHIRHIERVEAVQLIQTLLKQKVVMGVEGVEECVVMEPVDTLGRGQSVSQPANCFCSGSTRSEMV